VVLVVGPAAGTPLLVGALGRREDSRVVVPSGPEWAVALGAVRLARQPAGPVPAPMRTTGPSHDPRPRTTVEPSPSPPPGAVRSAPPTRSTGAPTAPPATRTAGADARSGGTRVRAAVIGIAAAFALLVGGGWAVSGAAGGHGGGGAGLSMSWGGHGH
jgi:hypothetical protein